ncbi:MAG: CopD family protein [Pseudomonadota bacterium]
MTFAELDWLSVFLRTLVYIATIAVAGSVLVRATLALPGADRMLKRQIAFGVVLLCVCEPIRYAAFQLSIAQGDWAMAFDPAMRWMGAETPLGQAAAVRLIGAAVVVSGLWWRPLALVGALLIVSSYLVEGHTVASDSRLLLAALLFLHLAIAHWWIGALLPLRAIVSGTNNDAIVRSIEGFGRKAVFAVAALLLAGLTMLDELVECQFDASSSYQQGFLLKLLGFALIIAIAGLNKMMWTPLLVQDPQRGRDGLRSSINIELAVAAAILFATAVATSSPPVEH